MERNLNDEKMYEYFQKEAKDIFAEFSKQPDKVVEFPMCQMTRGDFQNI